MDENKNKRELSKEQLEMVAGGGTAAAEEYLEQLMKEKGVERWDLYDNMTPEEYQHYYNLYYNPFLTDSRIKSVGRAKGILTTQGFLFFCPGILQVMVSYGIIEKGGIICS